jgi:hypothetical protein
VAADALSYFPRGLVDIRVLEVELKYEHILQHIGNREAREADYYCGPYQLEKLGQIILLLCEETRDNIAKSAIGTAWKMERELAFREVILQQIAKLPTKQMLRLLSNGRRALRLGLTLELPELSESLSRSMQRKGLSGE